MSKFKQGLIKCLPLLIVLVSTGIFIFAIKFVIGIFYEPKDTVYYKENGEEKFVVIQCYQNPSSHYYVLPGDFVYDETKYTNVASEHNNAHFKDKPLATFTLNETPVVMEKTVVKTLVSTSNMKIYQFGEFILYKLEGEYGVMAPLREYKESATKRKNDLYIVRQLLKEERYKNFELPSWETEKEFLKNLEDVEWYLDAEYNEDI